MKLAEALQLRSDIQKRLAQLSKRMMSNAKVQDGDKPAEDPLELIAEYEQLLDLYERLLWKINVANMEHQIDGMSITEVLAKRDRLEMQLKCYREFASVASEKIERYTRTEVRVFSTVNVTKFQKQVDALSRVLRVLNAKIQEANWKYSFDDEILEKELEM